MDLETLERELVRLMSGPLPGTGGQLPLAPRPRYGWRPGEWPDDCRHSGGLLLLYPRDGFAHVLLTVRADGVRHAGQVSLPGGAVEEGESYDAAALREAEEEVGLDPRDVRLLGGLSPLHIPVSCFVLHPRLAIVHSQPRFRPKPDEVARLVEVSLDELRDPSNIGVKRRQPTRFGEMDVPFFGVRGERVWGATAMILSEFLTLLGHPPDPWGRSVSESSDGE